MPYLNPMKAKSPSISSNFLYRGRHGMSPSWQQVLPFPAYASSVECEYGGYEQVFANTSSDGTSHTCTVTVDKKDMAFTFSITSSCRRSYQVSAQGGGAGGSYVDSSQVYNSNISSGTTPGSQVVVLMEPLSLRCASFPNTLSTHM